MPELTLEQAWLAVQDIVLNKLNSEERKALFTVLDIDDDRLYNLTAESIMLYEPEFFTRHLARGDK